MEERTPQDLKKMLIVFFVGIPILLIELFRAIVPSSGSSPQKDIIARQQNMTVEQKINTNPHLSWFEKNFCRGYKTSEFCKYFSDVVHPKHLSE